MDKFLYQPLPPTRSILIAHLIIKINRQRNFEIINITIRTQMFIYKSFHQCCYASLIDPAINPKIRVRYSRMDIANLKNAILLRKWINQGFTVCVVAKFVNVEAMMTLGETGHFAGDLDRCRVILYVANDV